MPYLKSPWAHGPGVLARPAEIVLTAEEVSELEALGDAANINTLREWEKER